MPTYNGWTNYETWVTNLWFDNFEFDEYALDDMNDECEDKDAVLWYIRDYIEQFVETYIEESMNDSIPGFITDLLNSAFQEIDFRDIAEHYVDDVWDSIQEMRLRDRELIHA